MNAIDKLDAMKAGKRIVTHDQEMDTMQELDSDTMSIVRSVPNPHQVGRLDQYVAWIDETIMPIVGEARRS